MVEAPSAVRVGGITFEISRLEEASHWLVEFALTQEGKGVAVRLANAYCVALASSNKSYGELLADRTAVNFPDGLPIVAVMRALSLSATPRRVRGPSLFREVLKEGVPRGLRHFFLGATPEVLDKLVKTAQADYPGLLVSGTYAPPFSPITDDYLTDLVSRASNWDTDIVWVGMGTPKQDFVTQALADRAGFVSVGVGAAFAFAAGAVKEAPRWVQRSGIEWAYRLVKEPRRLWQRYVFGNSRFVLLVARQLLSACSSRPTVTSHRETLAHK